MCTAVTYNAKSHYFGRTLDLEYSYGECVTITPRNFPFSFRYAESMPCHYAIIGIAAVKEGYPLYYDAVNEKGLAMAGLNFPENVVYQPINAGDNNIAPFEFIPWILAQCATVTEARKKLENLNLAQIQFNDTLSLTPLHWIISDSISCITVEPREFGLKIYENPVGILTNNPPFDVQLSFLNRYMGLSTAQPKNHFSSQLNLKADSRGMGAIGLPGDFSSHSRFVRAAFAKYNSVLRETEEECVNQFFYILGTVSIPFGCVLTEKGEYAFTIYTSCCDTEKGIYYYTTYENRQIAAVDLNKENLQGHKLIKYPLISNTRIMMQN